MKNLKLILTAFLLGITIFSLYKYLSSLQEKRQMQNSIKEAQLSMAAAEVEKQNLLQSIEKEQENNENLDQLNSKFKMNLRACNGKIFKLNQALEQEKKVNQELTSQSNLLKSENEALKRNDLQMREKFAEVSQENEAYKAKFNSITELKKAIRELKIRARQAVASIKEKVQGRRVIEGNRGYIIKDGKPTYPARIKIEVKPANDI